MWSVAFRTRLLSLPWSLFSGAPRNINSRRRLSFFPDLSTATGHAFPHPVGSAAAMSPDSKWPSAYVKKMVLRIHPDLFQGAQAQVVATNEDSLSRLNNIVDFLEQISSPTHTTIPAGGAPPAQSLTFYTSASHPTQVLTLAFAIPALPIGASHADQMQMAKGYCNQFLLDLVDRMTVSVPPSTHAWVRYHAQLACHRAATAASVMSAPSTPVATASDSSPASPLNPPSDFARAQQSSAGSTAAGEEDVDAATLGAVFGVDPHHAPAAGYRKANHRDQMRTALQRSLEAHRELARDVLFDIELDRHTGGVERLLRMMVHRKLIFYGNELTEHESTLALRNFCTLMRTRWYLLNVRDWFGLPIMFARDYSTHRAPGFIGTDNACRSIMIGLFVVVVVGCACEFLELSVSTVCVMVII
jgi:hypothetical protein